MEEQKQRVKNLEGRVAQAKASYAEALRNLEQISDEIHKVDQKLKFNVSVHSLYAF